MQKKSAAVIEACFRLYTNVLSPESEAEILKEIGLKLKTMKWNSTHLDNKIRNYREFCISDGNRFPKLWESLRQILPLISSTARLETDLLPPHILELRHDGIIMNHIDHPEYSGNFIAVLSLQRDSLLSVFDPSCASPVFETEIPARSLYLQWY